jgi:Tfp pilus assembly protein PilV
MRTFFVTLWLGQLLRLRALRVCARRRTAYIRDQPLWRRFQPARQDGFLLVEVIVSALLVTLIVVATFNGFDVVNRAQADDRAHDQAVILAAQSQEQMRTDPISTLQALEATAHVYTQTVNGTTYTITQEAAPSNGSANTTGCNATEATKQTGANVQITSKVTWPTLGRAKRAELTVSSIITPPTGAGLEVDVGNAPSPTEGVGGVTAVVTYTPLKTTTPVTVEGTTSSAGCVVFGDLEAKAATVAIKEKSGFVTTTGALKVQPKEVALAPNLTVHDAVTYNQGGAIQANFTWEGKSVTGDSFVASNTSIPQTPEFEVGANHFSYETTGEENYQAEPGTYASSAITAKGTRYSTGDLFPFLEPNKWLVYSGDCLANNPHSIDAAVTDGEVLVKAGATSEVNVPISLTALVAREGTQKNPSSSVSGLEVKLTDTACAASPTPNNASKLNITRFQKTTSAGALEFPYQPFGAYELCVANKSTKKRYKYSSSNTTPAGTTPSIYLGAKSPAEKSEIKTKKEGEEKAAEEKRKKEEKEAREKEETKEAEAKAKRITEEKPSKEKWEKEEKTEKTTKEAEETTKATRLAKEKTEVEQWKKEEECQISKIKTSAQCIASGKKEITKKQKEEKEAAQKTTRVAAEKTEKEAEEKRKTEEAATKTARELQQNTEKAKEKTEKETKETREKTETKGREKKEAEEKEVREKREKEEKEETEEATSTKVTVESGSTTTEKC